ncbi:MAG: 4Fe-4S dicluster domain-containing protein [Deltaproteobacteria bacterium]
MSEVARQAASDNGKELRIRCSRVGGRCTAVTCHGSLDYAFLDALCLRSEKDLRLLAGDCEDCGRATGGEVVRANIDAANRFMLLFGRRERVILTESADRQDLGSASRRAMFRDVGRTISKFVPEIKYPEPDIGTGQVPARQQWALEIIRGLEEKQRELDPCVPLPFYGKEIDAAMCDICNGTPKCVRFCPTDALEYSAVSGSVDISFKAGRCIGCHLCEAACHKDAVKSFALKSGQVEELRSAKPIMVFEAQECDGCGGTAIVTRGGLCLDCQQRERKLGWGSVG